MVTNTALMALGFFTIIKKQPNDPIIPQFWNEFLHLHGFWTWSNLLFLKIKLGLYSLWFLSKSKYFKSFVHLCLLYCSKKISKLFSWIRNWEDRSFWHEWWWRGFKKMLSHPVRLCSSPTQYWVKSMQCSAYSGDVVNMPQRPC